jgi:hypothetical protein
LARATDTTELAELMGRGAVLREQWEDLDISRRQAIVKSVLSYAVIGPGQSGARCLDIDRVDPVWAV